MRSKSPIVYLDNHLIVAVKAAGMLVQGDKSQDETLLQQLKAFIGDKYDKPGKVFLGLVHRLDRPVSGLVVMARNSKSAARLSQQIREKRMRKTYLALVEGTVPKVDTWTDQLRRNGKITKVSKADGKPAKLTFKRIHHNAGISLVKIELITGRHHQIRAQFASRNFPVVGDVLYGANKLLQTGQIALHSYHIGIQHPVSHEELEFFSQQPEWNSYLIREQ